MKFLRNIFLVLLCFAAFNYVAIAKITPEEARDASYIQNHGHSKEMSRLMDLQRKQVIGEPTEDKTKKPFYTWPVRMFVKVRNYIDPIYDDGSFGDHEIHTNPSHEDL